MILQVASKWEHLCHNSDTRTIYPFVILNAVKNLVLYAGVAPFVCYICYIMPKER